MSIWVGVQLELTNIINSISIADIKIVCTEISPHFILIVTIHEALILDFLH